ncbi:hypothetical protein EWM63_02195 [Pseudoduganella lutea]|uniref:Flagellar assembly protein FliH n=1 Tax=Pseudoduganella lutea TaxID=321985 RepID=A0A4P6KV00_9BURK|nr:hypothetical protein EWM63_02195 [Pseudoduganella lutea]
MLRADEFDQLLHAGRARLRPDLGRERVRVLEAAHEQAERLRREAAEAGAAEGRALYAAQLAALALQREQCWRQIETDLVDIVLACVKRLLGADVASGAPQALVPRIHALLREYRPHRHVGLRVAPSALPMLRAALPELEEAHPHVTLFQVIPDPHLDAADVLIETQDAVIDGRFATQIAALRLGIASSLQAPVESGAAS